MKVFIFLSLTSMNNTTFFQKLNQLQHKMTSPHPFHCQRSQGNRNENDNFIKLASKLHAVGGGWKERFAQKLFRFPCHGRRIKIHKRGILLIGGQNQMWQLKRPKASQRLSIMQRIINIIICVGREGESLAFDLLKRTAVPGLSATELPLKPDWQRCNTMVRCAGACRSLGPYITPASGLWKQPSGLSFC